MILGVIQDNSTEMKGKFTLLLVLSVAAGCSRDDSKDSIIETADSTKLLSRDKALEKAIWDYYLSIEEDVRMDLGVSEAEIVERVQSMINDGYIKKPVILVVTKDGPRWATVDNYTYKEYMTSNAIISRRYYGTQPDILDSLLMDSIRSNLFDALKVDKVSTE
jgi:hypothetical protein